MKHNVFNIQFLSIVLSLRTIRIHYKLIRNAAIVSDAIQMMIMGIIGFVWMIWCIFFFCPYTKYKESYLMKVFAHFLFINDKSVTLANKMQLNKHTTSGFLKLTKQLFDTSFLSYFFFYFRSNLPASLRWQQLRLMHKSHTMWVTTTKELNGNI